ncbi:DUF3040 domain-containing protein [Streptomyces sp. NPDC001380]|uniref:DUF3040 domain-containing protein n=1 Tax=Streptomyces sp. NPDC001380 TaxID=3364566 RepID=UPI0036AD2900
MGLSMHDRRVLADIERHLSERDPVLARLLASFGDRRSRVRAAARDVWLGTVVIGAGLAFLLGVALFSVGVAGHDRAMTAFGAVAFAAAELTVVCVLAAAWRRRRAG